MKDQIFKISVAIVGFYHFALGVVGLVCPVETVTRIAAITFGLSLDVTPQLPLILKFTSVYLLVFGIMVIVFSIDGIKYRIFAIPVLSLFVIRLINRLVFFNELISAGVSPTRNLIGIGFILIFFLVILLTLPKEKQDNIN